MTTTSWARCRWNRPQLWAPLGTSELADVISISDAACKIATDMMISSKFHAMPRRWALGFDDEDFVDTSGKRVSVWQTIAGKIWSTPKNKRDDGVEVGQFAEADLRNFHETLRTLAVLMCSVSGMAMHALGYSSDNPASVDGIRSAEARHVKRQFCRLGRFNAPPRHPYLTVKQDNNGETFLISPAPIPVSTRTRAPSHRQRHRRLGTPTRTTSPTQPCSDHPPHNA